MIFNISKETRDKVISELLSSLEQAEAEVRRLKADLEALGHKVNVGGDQSNHSENLISNVEKQYTVPGTFNEVILHILNDGVPRTSRQLLNEYNSLKNKDLSLSAFSAQLSSLVKNKNLIKIHTAKNSSISNKYWYGRLSWFDGAELKPEYKARIKVPAMELWTNKFEI